MQEFFVWKMPSLVHIIEAASEQDAAEAFLDRHVTWTPVQGKPPACFVQPTGDLKDPRVGEAAREFWVRECEPLE